MNPVSNVTRRLLFSKVKYVPRLVTARGLAQERLAHLDGEGAIVDIGCGAGDLLASLQSQYPNWRYIGVEPMPQASMANHAGIEFVQGTGGKIPLPDQTAKVVICTDVIQETSETPDKVFREVSRILEPGGWLILTVPEALSVSALFPLQRILRTAIPRFLEENVPGAESPWLRLTQSEAMAYLRFRRLVSREELTALLGQDFRRVDIRNILGPGEAFAYDLIYGVKGTEMLGVLLLRWFACVKTWRTRGQEGYVLALVAERR